MGRSASRRQPFVSNCDPNCAGGTVLTLSLVNDTDRLAKDRHNFAEPPRRCACCRSSSFGQSLPVYRRMVSERAGRRAYQIRRSSPAMRFSCQESVSSSNDPSHTPDVLNYLINSFLRPTPSPYIPGGSVFLQFGREVIGPLISLLPPQLQAVVGSAFAKIGAALAQGLSHLPGNLGLGAMYVGSAAADLPSALLNLNFDIHALAQHLVRRSAVDTHLPRLREVLRFFRPQGLPDGSASHQLSYWPPCKRQLTIRAISRGWQATSSTPCWGRRALCSRRRLGLYLPSPTFLVSPGSPTRSARTRSS